MGKLQMTTRAPIAGLDVSHLHTFYRFLHTFKNPKQAQSLCLGLSPILWNNSLLALRPCKASFGGICLAPRSGHHLQFKPSLWALGFPPYSPQICSERVT
jgi:hypothetical protein